MEKQIEKQVQVLVVVPAHVESVVKSLRDLEMEYSSISRRIGTYGERGLHPRRKSIISQINKLRKSMEGDTEWKIVYKDSYPHWFCAEK